MDVEVSEPDKLSKYHWKLNKNQYGYHFVLMTKKKEQLDFVQAKTAKGIAKKIAQVVKEVK